MQNAALRTATGCTQDTNIQHLHDENTCTPHTRAPTAPRLTIQTENTSITSPTQTHFNTPRLNTIFNNGRYATNIHTVTTTDIKTNMCHIYLYTSIVSRYIATRGNNKILRTPPPHISSSEDILVLTGRTHAQLRINKSCLHKVDAKSHTALLCPFVTLTSSPMDLWTDPTRVTALLAR